MLESDKVADECFGVVDINRGVLRAGFGTLKISFRSPGRATGFPPARQAERGSLL